MATDSMTDPSDNQYEFIDDDDEEQGFILEYTDEKGQKLTPNFGDDKGFINKVVQDIQGYFFVDGDNTETEYTIVTFGIKWRNRRTKEYDSDDLDENDTISGFLRELSTIIDFGQAVTVVATKTRYARPAAVAV
ncbi:hypothetical protein GGH92_002303 [Coemansia sp. RSA 2673]|nr:hypothetical protein GGH13_005110 [Coemansia sp. S155-1]KAJ2350530.1 hypothetical protein GGH92_002303 [Coemansia sp. RSA 2673]